LSHNCIMSAKLFHAHFIFCLQNSNKKFSGFPDCRHPTHFLVFLQPRLQDVGHRLLVRPLQALVRPRLQGDQDAQGTPGKRRKHCLQSKGGKEINFESCLYFSYRLAKTRFVTSNYKINSQPLYCQYFSDKQNVWMSLVNIICHRTFNLIQATLSQEDSVVGMASCAHDGTVKLWNLVSDVPVASLDGHEERVSR
jgi:hypothetical protein